MVSKHNVWNIVLRSLILATNYENYENCENHVFYYKDLKLAVRKF